MENVHVQPSHNCPDASYRAFCVCRIRELLEQVNSREADLIYRFARGLIHPNQNK